MQPRWLTAQLEEFDYQTDYQSDMIRGLVQQVQSLLMLTSDVIQASKSDVHACYEKYLTLEKRYQAALELNAMRAQRVEDQLEASIQAEQQSEQQFDHCGQVQHHWQHQVDKAIQWVKYAIEEHNRCVDIYNDASHKLDNAQRDLRHAETQLDIARRRPPVRVYIGDNSRGEPQYRYDPPDTSYERAQVSSAISHVNRCQSALQSAAGQLKRAKHECAQAERQRDGAIDSRNDAIEAVALSKSGVELAGDAKHHAVLSVKYSDECSAVLSQIQVILEQFKQVYEQQSTMLGRLDNDHNDALINMRQLETQQETVQGETYTLKYTLQDKINLLIAFDQPLNRSY